VGTARERRIRLVSACLMRSARNGKTALRGQSAVITGGSLFSRTRKKIGFCEDIRIVKQGATRSNVHGCRLYARVSHNLSCLMRCPNPTWMSWQTLLCLLHIITLTWLHSREFSLGITTGCGLDDWGIRVRVLVGSRIFSSPRRPDRLWGPLRLLYNGYRWLFPGSKATGTWSSTFTSN
jgi:hypothetical protein